ncbi:ATP-grasp domain-containing protein [Streptomyces sp. NPDC048604]|uniref:ATP-grasp domain-containing protein n=1 Tax=Streptomyces sp. NPDC048604 TaxID=3365578 RepID=UPI003723503F
MPPSLLYCADPLDARRADAHFAAEARAARALGAAVALVDHDALIAGDTERAAARVPRDHGPCWYRGWMIPADRYRDFAEALERRGAPLLVTPERYRAAHELPGWYEEFAELTPPSAWTDGLRLADLGALARRLPPGPGIVKDYVKSRKHEWDEACYVPDLHDPAGLGRVAGRFAELQGDWLAGGVVLRSFEPYEKPAAAATELRLWWLDGTPRLVTPHPDGPAAHDADPVPAAALDRIAAAVARLGCRFVTTDLARRTDGVWRVVEVGDGQVSDAHAATAPGLLPQLLLGPEKP